MLFFKRLKFILRKNQIQVSKVWELIKEENLYHMNSPNFMMIIESEDNWKLQQNRVAEQKNRTIMNMIRSMLLGKKIPKNFWPKAVNWTCFEIRVQHLPLRIRLLKKHGAKPNLNWVFSCFLLHLSCSCLWL